MSMGLIFWIIMLIWLLFGFFSWSGYFGPHLMWGGSVLLFVLLGLLGWKVFGAPVRG